MDKNQMQGNWQQLKGRLLKEWGKLTDEDLKEAEGKSEIIIGKIKERYGLTKDEASQKYHQFVDKLKEKGNQVGAKIYDTAKDFNERAHEIVDKYRE